MVVCNWTGLNVTGIPARLTSFAETSVRIVEVAVSISSNGRTNRGKNMPTRSINKPAEQPFQIFGILQDKNSGRPVPGYRIVLNRARSVLAETRTNVDGSFLLSVPSSRSKRTATSADMKDISLTVSNRAGEVVHEASKVKSNSGCDPRVIEIDWNPESDRPVGPPMINPFKELRTQYRSELAAIERLGIDDKTSLLNANASELASVTGIPLQSIETIRLHADLAHAHGFSTEIAQALVAAGMSTRERLASVKPNEIIKALEASRKRGIPQPKKAPTPSTIYGWVGYAKGLDPMPFSSPMNLRKVLADSKKVTDRVSKLNPKAEIAIVSGLLNPFNRLQTMARIRGLMEAAGVHDLSSLGTFWIRGRRIIRPGYYVASKFSDLLTGVVNFPLISTLAASKGSFKKLKNASVLDDAIHLVPNPVTDAVIIGSLVEFIEDGKLIIGKEVTSLVIITEEILYSQLNEISYEESGRTPEPRAPMVPNRAATGTPRNDPNVYSPGSGDRGRNGGPGSMGQNGGSGLDGDSLGPAPDVEIYVQRTPEGLPDIHLMGRRGGSGQPGQHGGHGSDGARGREASSGACYCHRGVGRGGDGGPGGPGGIGGTGGAGASGGSLTIGTLTENIAPLTTLRPLFVDIAGGPGGNAGDRGIGGEGGRGGAAGDDSWPWCDEEPSRVGTKGPSGGDGASGTNGATGPAGSFKLQPITLSDWNALFNQPWIVRLEPWEGLAGAAVHAVARNITSDTVVIFDGIEITPTARDLVTGTLDFTVPTTASGGLNSVQLRLMGINGQLFSNTVSFRVKPELNAVTPNNGVPGTPIRLEGRGFASGAQVRFGGTTFPCTFVSGTVLSFTLPDHESIGMPAGTKDVQVVNPDGRESGILTFELTLDIKVRVKAWRVFPDLWVGGGGGFGGPGPGRDVDDVRDIFMESDTAGQVWAGHNIILEFDPNVGVAVVPADWAESWPIENVTKSENEDVLKAVDSAGNFLHFDPGAVNFYFVSDIDDWTTHAYTYRGSSSSRQEFVIFEDTPLLTDWEEAHVAAHELGHVLSLPHVCDDDSAGTTFGRTCSQDYDRDFLMYPSTNFWTDEGNTVTVEEAKNARKAARLWHNL